MTCSSKTAGHRAKVTENLDLRVVERIWGTFDLEAFQVILGPFGARLKVPINSKTASSRAKPTKT